MINTKIFLFSIFFIILIIVVNKHIILEKFSERIDNNNSENLDPTIQEFVNKSITICMKTLYRRRLLKEHLKFIRKKLPNIKVIISDDSDEEYIKETKNEIKQYLDKNTTYIELPFDSGLSKGRNECVKLVTTPYIILTDDSRTIDISNKKLIEFINFLEKNREYSLITGYCPQRSGIYRHFTKEYYFDDEKKIKEKDIDKSKGIKYNNFTFYKIGRGNNTFIARTKVLKENKWNDKMKVGEHRTFFRNLFKNDIKSLYCKDLIFKQFNNSLRRYDKNGSKMRHR